MRVSIKFLIHFKIFSIRLQKKNMLLKELKKPQIYSVELDNFVYEQIFL